ncbi:hypothetical protein [Amycolatopsis vancoresmycina]|uniref:Uncharacterized protein n=1 Tax=Amycolatopsis vancoresmycina DSM 44592 TaxID=1292037 RepID=R1IFD7_9PSEU|nr:hypothetical protein [Amycolatopsis vancoresmycina]EOD69109.1 hypothetical protein H480_07848 [Amycolatopsis vancoresmycina DSM 44592]
MSRWENSTALVPHAAVRRYETMLGIRGEALVAITDTVARYYRGTADAAPRLARCEIADDIAARRLDTLVDLAVTGGNVSGPEWNELTALLCRTPYAILSPKRTWETLSERLLTEMAISDGVKWMHRAEAFQRLMAHPVGGAAAIAAAASASADLGVQSMVGTVSVFDSTAAPAAAGLVVGHLASPLTDRTFAGALLACFRKVGQGHFRSGQLVVVSDLLTDLLGGPVSAGSAALAGAILRQLPLGLRQRVPVRIWNVLAAELPGPPEWSATDEIAAAVAATDTEAWDDAVLRELIREALFADVFDQRLYAQFMIYSTPCRAPVARELGAALRHRRRDKDWAVPLVEALRVIGGPAERRDIELLVLDRALPAAVRDTAASALGHVGGTSPDAFWVTALAATRLNYHTTAGQPEISVLDRLVYAMGMAGADGALSRVSATPDLPVRIRASARWWLSLSPCLRQSART